MIEEYPFNDYNFYLPLVYHHCTLKNFDFSGSNKKLLKIVESFVEGETNGLYIYGGFGVGKTHLAVGLYKVLMAKLDETSPSFIFFTTFESLINELRGMGDTEEGRHKKEDHLSMLCDCEVLFLDDITVCNKKEDVEILRKVVNGRYELNGRTVFTANCDLFGLAEYIKLHSHSISRIDGMCETIEIKGRDRRHKDRK